MASNETCVSQYFYDVSCILKITSKGKLGRKGITGHDKKLFVSEIFGKQEGSVKFFGPVDCETEEEFDSKLEGLKVSWEEREKELGNGSHKRTFFEWFQYEKVVLLLHV